MARGPLTGLRMALLLLTAVELVVFLDVSIVNVALPSMAATLALGEAGLAWVVNAYQLTFGGFQLVGGRASDILGRRRVFRIGLTIFTVASLLAGLAPWAWLLILARALQGVGAALVVPAELALLTSVFTEPRAYQRAFGVWSAMGAAGAASGVALGGILTQEVGWPWIFLVNVPIGIVALAFSGRYLPADEQHRVVDTTVTRTLDVWGAITGTGGLILLVYVLSVVPQEGWDPLVTGALVVAVGLLVAFAAIERRVANPLLPLRLFRIRNVTGSAAANFMVGAAHVPAFVFLSLYFQDVLHYSPIAAGFAVLPIALMNVAVSRAVVPWALARLGPRMVLAAGFALLVVGLGGLGFAPTDGEYAIDVLPYALVFAVGLPAIFVGSTLPAVKSVRSTDTGIVSGTVNTTQRIGSSVGVTLLTVLAVLRTNSAADPSTAAALNSGYAIGFLGAAGFAVLGLLIAVTILTPLPTDPELTGAPRTAAREDIPAGDQT
ncbi:MFS transporter [Actinocrispum sp. NPDC049592]|uniref:MFS transporter n=1 Tax=Actinocrispum sp. NPDC049592 TaxID=3154835 RepID=UPI0034269F9F